MDFNPDKVQAFLEVFNGTKHLIRNFPGVLHLELHRDAGSPHVFYTYSIWENEEALEVYRQSELFQNVWSQTKVLFQGKPQAFSLDRLTVVENVLPKN
jgi:quinol monooxygenase YgiN